MQRLLSILKVKGQRVAFVWIKTFYYSQSSLWCVQCSNFTNPNWQCEINLLLLVKKYITIWQYQLWVWPHFTGEQELCVRGTKEERLGLATVEIKSREKHQRFVIFQRCASRVPCEPRSSWPVNCKNNLELFGYSSTCSHFFMSNKKLCNASWSTSISYFPCASDFEENCDVHICNLPRAHSTYFELYLKVTCLLEFKGIHVVL